MNIMNVIMGITMNIIIIRSDVKEQNAGQYCY